MLSVLAMLSILSMDVACSSPTPHAGSIGAPVESNERQDQPTSNRLVGGVETDSHVGIGFLEFSSWICTATLISPRVVVTAHHCNEWKDVSSNSVVARFVVESRPGVRLHQRTVVRVAGFGTNGKFNEDDVAFMLLESAMPIDVPPEPIARTYPDGGETFEQYGYGCQSRPAKCTDPKPAALGRKQRVDGIFGQQEVSCSGDSGGPLLVNGEIVGVSSGAICGGSGADITANVTARIQDLGAVMSGWGICDGALDAGCDGGTCEDGACKCPQGHRACAGRCTKIGTSENCSGCGDVCEDSLLCKNGQCGQPTRIECEKACRREFAGCKSSCDLRPSDCKKRCQVANAQCLSACP